MAERLGLQVVDKPHVTIGFSQSVCGPVAKEFETKFAFKRELFAMNRLEAVIAANGGTAPVTVAPAGNEPKQTTRMKKCMCPKCGYTARIAAKWIQVGLPTCPCGTELEAE